MADAALLSSVVWQDDARTEYVLEGTVNGAGCAVEAMAAACAIPMEHLWAEADSWLAETREPPLFLNGVSGLGSPYWVPDFPSRLLGAGDGPRRMVAVFESIAFLLAINVERLAVHPPALDELEVTGGLARLDGLCQRIADLCDRPVERPAFGEGTIRGLGYLLAKRPSDWRGERPSARFEPRTNPPLCARYRQWRRPPGRSDSSGMSEPLASHDDLRRGDGTAERRGVVRVGQAIDRPVGRAGRIAKIPSPGTLGPRH